MSKYKVDLVTLMKTKLLLRLLTNDVKVRIINLIIDSTDKGLDLNVKHIKNALNLERNKHNPIEYSTVLRHIKELLTQTKILYINSNSKVNGTVYKINIDELHWIESQCTKINQTPPDDGEE